jgi:DNA (cytosine-5)-methyltransferase 1
LDRLIWEQWISGEYWDEHRISRRKRPEMPHRIAGRVERLKTEFGLIPPPGERCRTVRDAISDLPDPRDRNNTVPNHEFRDGARPYPGHTGALWQNTLSYIAETKRKVSDAGKDG